MKIRSSRLALSTAALAVTALTLSACGSGRTDSDSTADGESAGESIIVGTTDSLTTLDPAGSYDNGSFHVQTQVFSFLMSFEPGGATLAPDAAESCDFTSDTVYTCTLKDGLTFANGNALTAESVKFSFDRQLAIADPNGPSSLLANLDSVAAPDEKTVEFTLTSPNDQTFAQVLASPVGPIVDEATFPADALLDDDAIVEAEATSGPYLIKSFAKNSLVEFTPNADYTGVQGDVMNDGVTLKYYTDSNNLKLDIESGAIDIATRSLTATDIESLESTDGVNVVSGPGGEIRYVVFNFDTMPGETPEQKLAVRKAFAFSIDREDLSEQVYKGTYTPLYSYVPEGLPGAATPFEELYGTAPDADAATAVLAEAGVATPVELNLQYNPDHYGPSSDQEYNAIKRQLEETGLFTVNLQSTEWVTYAEERTADAYPAYQLGWFPDFSDADNYLTPFFDKDNFLGNHFEDEEISEMLDSERTDGDVDSRLETIEDIQQILAESHLSTVPLLQGSQVAVARDGVSGVEDTLNASFQFRYSVLSKG
ncbi:ABC transporter substrate-binding protein [Sanguibacter antarcticus]|uniref:Peptide/nickel transport system substrate-binding protein n=1 Tax=Sanguibacter antarcticus TaxID=372484 RepID=A0A2A9E5D7_9MICO|nr:ABC transporter substrate-binding protein [Sanguibacter antarcticus]PFG34267.1 peptide/nickel transport system substrate-binding protein [Sanguibacter antarcticus]